MIQLETIRTECPACNKRYSVDPTLINSAQPRFECVQCHSHFYFDYPLDEGSQAQAQSLDAVAEPTRPCPKCGTTVPANSRDCSACGIVFQKYMSWKKDGEYWQSFNKELNQAWRQVLRNYEAPEVHQAFLEKCLKAGKLDVAARFYNRILEADGSDDIAISMKEKVAQIAAVSLERNRPTQKRPTQPHFSWQVGIFSATLTIGAIFVIVGFCVPSARNLVGAGVAMVIMAAGLGFYVREILK